MKKINKYKPHMRLLTGILLLAMAAWMFSFALLIYKIMTYTKKHFLSMIGLIIGAGVIGLAGGVLFGSSMNHGADHSGHSNVHMDHSNHAMEHGSQLVVGDIPSIAIKHYVGKMHEVSLELETENFSFTPENIDAEEIIQNQGHAHLYINDEKKGRIYSNWYHVPSSRLVSGSNTIKISLHADNHDTWENEGEIIHDEIIIEK